MNDFKITDLYVEIDGKEILKGINLEVNENEIHALMGPNGGGKSTLVQVIMGHPKYKVTKGSITYKGKEVLELPVDERSKLGIFLGMQYPQEINGITNSDFLRACLNARSEKSVPFYKFFKLMEENVQQLEMKSDLAHRFLNVNFSGGEKKRNEIVQMNILDPSFCMLDEIDSGLDVDALKLVADAINAKQRTFLVVSHYERFYDLVKPTFAHVIINGKIVKSGDYSLVKKIDEEGYDWLYKELDIKPVQEEKAKAPISIGTCKVNG